MRGEGAGILEDACEAMRMHVVCVPRTKSEWSVAPRGQRTSITTPRCMYGGRCAPTANLNTAPNHSMTDTPTEHTPAHPRTHPHQPQTLLKGCVGVWARVWLW